MKIVDFEGSNTKFAEDQPEFETLPAHFSKHEMEGTVTSCWELDDEDIRKLLVSKRIYVQLQTYHRGLPAQSLSVDKPELI